MMAYVKNKDLHEPAVMEMILSYLHEMQIPVDREVISIQSYEDLDHIKNADYVVLPVFEGTPIWFCIFTKADAYYAVTFPRFLKRNVYNVKIYPINMKFSKSIYAGTIMEGTVFQNGGSSYLVITDAHYLAGQRLTTMSREGRLNRIKLALQDHSTITDEKYNLSISICYHLDKFSLDTLFSYIRNATNVTRLHFCPNNAGSKVYEYVLMDEDRYWNIVRKGIFDLQKIGSDVYHLCHVDSNERVGIAYIPDIHVSKMCAAWFKGRNKVRAVCIQDNVTQKYVPSELIE